MRGRNFRTRVSKLNKWLETVSEGGKNFGIKSQWSILGKIDLLKFLNYQFPLFWVDKLTTWKTVKKRQIFLEKAFLSFPEKFYLFCIFEK